MPLGGHAQLVLAVLARERELTHHFFVVVSMKRPAQYTDVLVILVFDGGATVVMAEMAVTRFMPEPLANCSPQSTVDSPQ